MPRGTAHIDTGMPRSTARIDTGMPRSIAHIDTGMPRSTARIDTGMPRSTARIDTPVGTLHVSVSGDGDVRVDWGTRGRASADRYASADWDARASAALAACIRRWLHGDTAALRSAPLPQGTPWQVACWRAARRIPRGQTRTYLWLAREACRELGRPASAAPALARAAGQAMRRNPAPIVVPCHRVVSASGIGGYAGTDDPRSRSLARKRWLLGIESGTLLGTGSRACLRTE